jgi:hypothetical protein
MVLQKSPVISEPTPRRCKLCRDYLVQMPVFGCNQALLGKPAVAPA